SRFLKNLNWAFVSLSRLQGQIYVARSEVGRTPRAEPRAPRPGAPHSNYLYARYSGSCGGRPARFGRSCDVSGTFVQGFAARATYFSCKTRPNDAAGNSQLGFCRLGHRSDPKLRRTSGKTLQRYRVYVARAAKPCARLREFRI
ncbi:hypothetical protein, partial [Paratractidigestivibacter sp.]|uniref:hypothetical protein n=1 Tax=Paratractidigestivibacter sp. TaxID=2847316 RepID=UPI002ACB1749